MTGAAASLAAAPSFAQAPSAPTLVAARAVLAKFLADANHDRRLLMGTLRPTAADYRLVWREPFATRLDAAHAPLWARGETFEPKPDQTELDVVLVLSDELIDRQPVLAQFPGGYARIVEHLARGIPIARFRFHRPGATAGLAGDGLVHVGGRWVLMPKPWRALDDR